MATYQKKYFARLICQPDTHFAPDIHEIGIYDTEYEAQIAAETVKHEYDWTSPVTGKVCNWWEIQIIPMFV